MMELTCAYIFLLISVVSATPHGYGTKGGASAKAEASATAGAFGDIKALPLSIPSGSGFSGSYSKSSSSSFSSASSSASSSSSSFSYSGSGSAGLHGFRPNSIAEANGVAGANGAAGASGLAGANGPAGANGLAGAHSLAGANGLAGGNSFAGSHGLTGSNSLSGANGLAGTSGATGAYSLAGAHGLAGGNGFAEPNDLSGTHGLGGANSLAGTHGFAGVNGVTGAHGPGGANGLAGTHGLSGTNSLAGANGFAGANGLTGAHGLAGGTTGCGTGACLQNKANGIPIPHGAGGIATNQGHSGANAAAVSNAVAGTYGFTSGADKACVGTDCLSPSSGCDGSDCITSDTSNKCTSGQCGFESQKKDDGCSSGNCANVPQPGPASSSYESPTECTSGKCGLNVQTNQPTIATFGSNDIPAKKIDTTLTSASKDNYADKTFTGYHGTSSHSNSKSSERIDSQHHSGNIDIHSQLHGVPKCHSSNCNAYDSTASTSSPGSGLPIGYTKPATYLTTPKVEAPCDSPTCKLDFGSSTGKPTSYNVPLHTSIGVPKQEVPCNNGNCGINQVKNPFPTLGHGSLTFEPAGPIGCTTPNCAEQSSSNSASDCKLPHCAPNYASAPTGSGSGLNYQPGLPSYVSLPTKPNYVAPVIPTSNPSHGHFNPGCKTPDCSGYVNAGSGSGAHSQNEFLPGSSGSVLPSYSTPVLIPSTPTFGHSPHTPSNTGNYGVTTVITPGHKQPMGGYVEGFGGPTGILKPNEFIIPTNTHVVVPSHTGSSNVIKPSIGVSPSSEELPPYTGGFGGPHGLLKPHEFDIKPPTTLNAPTSSVSPSGHDLPTYTGGFGAPSGPIIPNEISIAGNAVGAKANSNTGSFGTVSPNTGVTTPIQKVPINHGTYVAPSETLRPGIDTNVGVKPIVHLGSPVLIQPVPTGYSTNQALLAHGGLAAPIGSVQPNTHFSSNHGISSNVASGHINSNGLGGHHGHTHSTSGDSTAYKNLPTYTGGFGGAAGVLIPNNLKESSGTGYKKTETPSNTKPAPCSSETCDVVSSNAVAVAKADAVAYTGGFGGPPGLFKPHDGGKLDSKSLSNAQFGLHHGVTGTVDSGIGSSGKVDGVGAKAPIHDTHGQSSAAALANAGAQASATAGATSGSFGSNNAYSNGQAGIHAGDKSGSGCGGGCGGGNYHGSGSDFGSTSALSIANAGVIDGPDSGLHGNVASAKSLAGTVGGSRAFGGTGSFASSSASAHASAGYATKGGYGK